MCEALDSAIVRMKADDAAELAALYDSRQKEAQIAQQQADLTRQRYVGTLVALLLVSIFFVVYTLYKRKAQQRLADAHTKLQEAYDQLEETTTAKERIESELRIARDIQMSMVPSVFPEREGLDLYASMTPAREVGGDLYSYLLQDDHLYFCIGDVSGKGVPASLFMAQAIRLFRTMAAQQRMPAEIATRMNAALTEDNVNGMFITMFIGLVDLTTGRLDFCNAGHNPPVLGGDAQQGSFMEVESNAPIGLWSELEFVGEHLDSIKGRPLFIYTDGLNEAENRQQEQFGEERMLDILRHTQFDNARHVIDVLCAAVEQHRDGAEPNDDLTMMCLKVNV
jgi:serine phosphatase RsbU (regulator of sigma subunit)